MLDVKGLMFDSSTGAWASHCRELALRLMGMVITPTDGVLNLPLVEMLSM